MYIKDSTTGGRYKNLGPARGVRHKIDSEVTPEYTIPGGMNGKAGDSYSWRDVADMVASLFYNLVAGETLDRIAWSRRRQSPAFWRTQVQQKKAHEEV